MSPFLQIRPSRHHRPRIQPWAAVVLLVFACLLSTARAAMTAEAAAVPTTAPPMPLETLMVDSRSLVQTEGHWTMLSEQEAAVHELRRRASSAASSSSRAAGLSSRAASLSSRGATTTFEVAVSTVTQSRSTTLPASPLPSPFDSSLGSNFTGNDGNGACPAFINAFLTSPTFKQCYPFSLLMQGSRSFFQAEKSLVSITQVLDATCNVNATFCANYLASLATNLTDASNCGADYNLGNPTVVQAYLGMIAYPALYSTSCLQDPETSMYCFANAVTNLTTPSNVYIYYLPLNISLPGSSIPSCSWCLQQTMAVFQSTAANRKLPIAYTYMSAAQQVDTICGPGFVNDTLPIAVVTNAAPGSFLLQGPSWLLLSGLLAAAIHLLL